eukprot:TRINITY_DN2015_c0_g1_i1.p1 TRINITY_DN2015_c0_g1~~TRINITY_DN2015_c0_g1_i1.p1  ORF type:complete len:138 (-),score=9.52 TRINITY_DN2015_c0_g1_i1:142-555(-)
MMIPSLPKIAKKLLESYRNKYALHSNSYKPHNYHKLLPNYYPTKVFALASYIAGSLIISPVAIPAGYQSLKLGGFRKEMAWILVIPLFPTIVTVGVTRGLARKWMNHPELMLKTDRVGWEVGYHILKWATLNTTLGC